MWNCFLLFQTLVTDYRPYVEPSTGGVVLKSVKRKTTKIALSAFKDTQITGPAFNNENIILKSHLTKSKPTKRDTKCSSHSGHKLMDIIYGTPRVSRITMKQGSSTKPVESDIQHVKQGT